MKNAAIVLSGGSGTRMRSETKKQYMVIAGYPVLWYSLHAFQQCTDIDEVILVCGAGEVERCRSVFVQQYGLSKISRIVEGGKERYHSVYEGLKQLKDCEYVLIHDGARPFLDDAILTRIFSALRDTPACAVGMPVKDTIKVRSPEGYVEQTLPREKLWMIQTPQAFSYRLIRQAYDELIRSEQTLDRSEGNEDGNENDRSECGTVTITDDAMVVEYFLHLPVKLIEGSYENMKITTPEDLPLAETLATIRQE
ncbi:MAG: 2-C-methyl-D-erythritol 4-phosphate cytidylyltransferase [Lachnospiraceae bacterium]|nr:2-C-methyl-D-erythritol 4-phosphate cytidylyltransferase [Lachnospiraceae bacterium]